MRVFLMFWKLLVLLTRPSVVAFVSAWIWMDALWSLPSVFFLGVGLICLSIERHTSMQQPPIQIIKPRTGRPIMGNDYDLRA